MRQFRDDRFVGADTLKFKWLGPAVLYLGGQIGWLGRIVIDVEKFLDVLDPPGTPNPSIQTDIYSYHVGVQSRASLFRYDNSHQHDGHPDPHHRHAFVWAGHKQLPDSPVWVGASNWPTLGDVIAETQAWYWDHYETLQDRDDFPSELRSGWGMG
jgi:hypothetical protein